MDTLCVLVGMDVCIVGSFVWAAYGMGEEQQRESVANDGQ